MNKAFGTMFKPWVKANKKYFRDLELPLKKAGMKYSVVEYASMSLFFAMLAFILSFAVTIITSFFFIDLIYVIFLSVSLSIAVGGAVFFILYSWPKQVLKDKIKRIDNSLHYIAAYISTLAGSGTPPHAIFKTLGKFKEFKEISHIINRINRDIELFGLELTESIDKVAPKIPSDNFKEMLTGLKATITSGGSLKRYLEEKTETYLKDYRLRVEEFSKSLSILLEIYITVVVVGTIFALILSTIMGLFGGEVNLQFIQILLVFILLPSLVIVFAIIIKTVSPVGR